MITFPLDTTKVRLQVQGELSSNNGAGAQPRGVLGPLVRLPRPQFRRRCCEWRWSGIRS